MDADLKSKWMQALRSGEYKQGRLSLYLEREESFCCLGVLCRVAGAHFKNLVFLLGDQELSTGGTLSESFRSTAGIGSNQLSRLITMNDDEARSFIEISDYIERHL